MNNNSMKIEVTYDGYKELCNKPFIWKDKVHGTIVFGFNNPAKHCIVLEAGSEKDPHTVGNIYSWNIQNLIPVYGVTITLKT